MGLSLGGGKLLQAVSATKTDTASTTSTSFASTGLSVTITPRSTTSKILILCQTNMTISAASGGVAGRIVRGATPILQADAAGLRMRGVFGNAQSGATGTDMGVGNIIVLDSPATLAATTYTLEWQVGAGTAYMNMVSADGNFAGTPRGASSLVALEIAG